MKYAKIRPLPNVTPPEQGWKFVFGGDTYLIDDDAVFPEEVALHAEDYFNRTPNPEGPLVELEWTEGELKLAPKARPSFECRLCGKTLHSVAGFTEHVTNCVRKESEAAAKPPRDEEKPARDAEKPLVPARDEPHRSP